MVDVDFFLKSTFTEHNISAGMISYHISSGVMGESLCVYVAGVWVGAGMHLRNFACHTCVMSAMA